MAKINWKTPEQIAQERMSPLDKLKQEIEALKARVAALELKNP
jgi:polyhydroxyalkanoate synthesis regulator phasin